MRKFFTVFIATICYANTCFALSLELSDVIKEAREIERAKLSQNQTQEKSIQPIKNTSKQNLQKSIEPIYKTEGNN